MTLRRVLATLVLILSLWLLGWSVLSAVPGQAQTPNPLPPLVQWDLHHDLSRPLRELSAVQAPAVQRPQVLRQARPAGRGAAPSSGSGGADPALQGPARTLSMPSTEQNFEGVSNLNGVFPPDSEGAVGPNHYMEWVNLSLAVYNKTGTLLFGPVAGNTPWSGFGGICESHNDGDPIVVYDQIANRWVFGQFAWTNIQGNGTITGPFYQCMAVSQSPDPTGPYFRYAFLISNTKLNDYPKLGVWPDGYYMTANQFNQGTPGQQTWAGQLTVSFERNQMLVGQPAQMVAFDLYGVNPNFGNALPGTVDGLTLPPVGSPDYFVEMDDDGMGYFLMDMLQVWHFRVDWFTPANSTFGLAGQPNAVLPTAPFDSNMCNYSPNCIPEPGTAARLDALSDRLMYRLQYRNFPAHESMVVNQTVDVGGDHAGVRWYQLRKINGSWQIYQQGSYAPDADNRWMGSIAMDSQENIALGYSVSSATTNPAIRYTGRLVSDLLGTLPQGEASLIEGAGVQTDQIYFRWGDYTAMQVDPSNDCTFWYINEYYPVTSARGWHTRIGSFTFPSCLLQRNPLQNYLPVIRKQ